MLKIWASAIYKWLMNGVIIAPERPLGVTIIGVSLLHPAIVILFEPVILSWKLAVCGALIVFSIGILKGKRSAFYILMFIAISFAFMVLYAIIQSPSFSINIKLSLLDLISPGSVLLVCDISVLVILSLPKSVDFFYSELK